MDRQTFIQTILPKVSSHIKANENFSARYSYEKGYLAEADLLANTFIIGAIKEYFPEDLVLSEEENKGYNFNDFDSDNKYLWIIDPICGSTNFLKRFPFYVHAISVADKKGVLYSGIYDPSHNELFLADRNRATLNGEEIATSGVAELNKSLVSLNCNQSDWDREDVNLPKLINKLAPPMTRRLHVIESANLEIAYVACGRLDAYINPHDKIWDIAAGSLMIKSAGGQIKLFSGNLFPPTRENLGVVATNEFLLSEINEALGANI
ncbi:MAG: hypothetical protein CMD75_01065 [Gammaproteobacteria bacterium]|nr:hypothetical protein [Gammaproteobacteria bacterium]|tara:strand:+ start:2797 stop:3591 length:795 start_codon:yes stop_codon:yes gene_type:complete